MAELIPPRRGTFLTKDGVPTQRFSEYLESLTSKTNSTVTSAAAIATNTLGVAANVLAIAANASDIVINTAAIATNTSAIAAITGVAGTAVLDFGVYPGSKEVELVVTGIPSISSLSLFGAEMDVTATASKTQTELEIDPLRLWIKDYVTGAGFTVVGRMNAGKACGSYNINYFQRA